MQDNKTAATLAENEPESEVVSAKRTLVQFVVVVIVLGFIAVVVTMGVK